MSLLVRRFSQTRRRTATYCNPDHKSIQWNLPRFCWLFFRSGTAIAACFSKLHSHAQRAPVPEACSLSLLQANSFVACLWVFAAACLRYTQMVEDGLIVEDARAVRSSTSIMETCMHLNGLNTLTSRQSGVPACDFTIVHRISSISYFYL